MTAAPRRALLAQFRVCLITVAGAFVVIGLFLLVADALDRPFVFFAGEPAEQLGGPFYVGTFATTGSVIWLAGAAAALMAALALRPVGPRRDVAFLAASGGLTMLLVLDDLYLLHESVYHRIGLTEDLIALVYANIAVAYLVLFRHEIGRTEPLVLVAAGSFLFVGLVLDHISWRHAYHVVLEEGAKLVGITLWTTFFVRTSAVALRTQFR